MRGGEETLDRSAGGHHLIRGGTALSGGRGMVRRPLSAPPRSAPSRNSGTAMSSLSVRRVSGTRGRRGDGGNQGRKDRAGAANLIRGGLGAGSMRAAPPAPLRSSPRGSVPVPLEIGNIPFIGIYMSLSPGTASALPGLPVIPKLGER